MNQGAVFKGALMSALPLTAGANADIAGLPRWADSWPKRIASGRTGVPPKPVTPLRVRLHPITLAIRPGTAAPGQIMHRSGACSRELRQRRLDFRQNRRCPKLGDDPLRLG
jgi:hypothetical protein